MKKQPEVWIVVLAAGFSKRMGKQKLMLPVGRKTLLRRSVKSALRVGDVSGVVTVLNAAFPMLVEEIKDLPVSIKQNEESYLGMSSSLRKGIEALPSSADAAAILLADQPGVAWDVVHKVVLEYLKSTPLITQASYQQTPGHPVIFDKQLFPQLIGIRGDQGAKEIIKSYKEERRLVHVTSPIPEDIDTLEDYERIILKRGLCDATSTNW
ncbi:molybdenum cofactor cytidylyltransferase [Evansella vedderi]|uniref:Molybdenum cofactor cytidylyltransferase n=1 Tax=Evansella vedderi TaxID=38282 RepID=A0ABT9ZQA4_9BACI|nr:nucleotidyltransferase family protein [Evansella vedderi]MDQ0253384.1 molybdenum cofactor cytidylyltransferase [Evansella vedderi]